ncbi:MAG: YjbF family lipoprotein [Formivibrio sp.]|nr:YjbF family lipoprotein [Formivibrio sp.]
MRLQIHNSARGLLVVGACFLGGCSGMHLGSDITSVYDYSLASFSAHRVTLEQAAATPYASMGIRIGDGDERIVVLATNTEESLLWTSAAHISLSTRDGRIIRTVGFGHDLANFTLVTTALSRDGSVETHWAADFPDIGAYSVPVTCESKSAGEETIDILGKALKTTRFVEHCSARVRASDWQFQNIYWKSPDSGFVWRAIQHVHPDLEALHTEIFRRPA